MTGPLNHERHAFTPRPDSDYCVCGLWETHHMHSGVSSAECTCMGCVESRDGAVAAWGLTNPTFRDRLGDALNAAPHFTVRETVATVMRVLGEHHGDLRDQIKEALESVEPWVPLRQRARLTEAVLPIVEAALAAERRCVVAKITTGIEEHLAETPLPPGDRAFLTQVADAARNALNNLETPR